MDDLMSRLIPEGTDDRPSSSTTDAEFKRFHYNDRVLFMRLILLVQRNPEESLNFMAFWMWIEKQLRGRNLISTLLELDPGDLNALAEETNLCIRCVQNEEFLFAGEELFAVKNFTGGKLTFKGLHDNRGEVVRGINQMMDEVCARAFNDLLAAANDVVGQSMQPPPPRSTLPVTAPPVVSAVASLTPTAPPFVPSGASWLHQTAPTFLSSGASTSTLPAAARGGYSNVTELIRVGSGPPSNEQGILGSGACEVIYNPNFMANTVQLRNEALNQAVAGQMLYLSSDLGQQYQPAAPMAFPGPIVPVGAMGMGFPGPNIAAAMAMGFQVGIPSLFPTLVGFPPAPMVSLLPIPAPVMLGYGSILPEPEFVSGDLIRLPLETMRFMNEDPGMEHVAADSRTLFLTFSKGYPISEDEVHDFFTRKFGNFIESIHMQRVQENEQPLFAKVVARSPAAVDAVVQTGRKYVINGKHVMARKFITNRDRGTGADAQDA